MTTPIRIEIEVDDKGSATVMNRVADGLHSVGNAAQEAGGSGGGIGSLVTGLSDMKAGFDILSSGLNQGIGMIASVNALGDASRKAAIGLDIMSKGAGDSFLAAGRAATHGLVDDMGLAQAASDGLARGLFKTSDQFKRIATDGAAMGAVLGTDAAGGVDKLENALEKVGSKRAVMALGLDAEEVMTRFKALKKAGEDATTAWQDALLGASDAMAKKLGPAIDNGPGAAITRLSVKWENFKASFAERVSIGIDGIAGLVDALSKPEVQALLGLGPKINAPGSNSTNQGGDFAKSPIEALQNQIDEQIARNNYFLQINGVGLKGKSPNDPSETGPLPSPYYIPQSEHAHGNAAAISAAQYSDRMNYISEGSGGDYRPGWAPSTIPAFGGQQLSAAGAIKAEDVTIVDSLVKGIEKAQAATVVLTGNQQTYVDSLKAAGLHQQYLNSITNLNQAFGLNQNGVYGQVDTTATGAAATARADLQKRDLQRGKGVDATNKDLAIFDAQNAKAADAYALATGGATKESLAFRDAQNLASKSLADGKMSVTDYWKEMQTLADAARNGKGSLEAINAIMYDANSTDKQPGSSGHGAIKGKSAADLSPGGGKGAVTITDVFGPVMNSAILAQDKVGLLTTGISAVQTTITNLAGVTPTYGATISNSFTPAVKQTDDLTKNLQNMFNLLKQMQGATFTVSTNLSSVRGGAQYG